MAKTITTPVTLHVKDHARSRPFRYDVNGGLISGRHIVIEVPPGTPVQFESDAEAARILTRFGGEEVAVEPRLVVPAVPDDDDVEPLQKLAPPAPPASENGAGGSDGPGASGDSPATGGTKRGGSAA